MPWTGREVFHIAGYDILRFSFERGGSEHIVVRILADMLWFNRIDVDHVIPWQALVGDNCGDIVFWETQFRSWEHLLKFVKNCR